MPKEAKALPLTVRESHTYVCYMQIKPSLNRLQLETGHSKGSNENKVLSDIMFVELKLPRSQISNWCKWEQCNTKPQIASKSVDKKC